MGKYHVAFSFAGEDREYVEAVAAWLRDRQVRVFYDKFEETKLWGKDLYAYLSDIYQNRAFYTVMFVSKAYRDKLWANHERKAAQARALVENQEYILPAFFDESVEIPGLLKTTVHISLSKLTPEQFAEKILQKLRESKVFLSAEEKFGYLAEAKADVDFPLSDGSKVAEIVTGLKTHNWYTQSPAIDQIWALDWKHVTADQIFVLGRNIYQCACGGERKAASALRSLRRTLASLQPEVAEHLLNGMFYEVYFDSKGEFRGEDLKDRFLPEIFSTQTVDRYRDCISFIRHALEPYRGNLAILPNTRPEVVELKVKIAKKAPPVVTSIECLGRELLVDASAIDDSSFARTWRLSFQQFTLKALGDSVSRAWHIPSGQLKIGTTTKISEDAELRLPEGKRIGRRPFD